MGKITPARFITHIGTNFWLRVFHYSQERPCPKQKDWGCDARIYIKTTSILNDNRWSESDFSRELFPRVCDTCGQPFGDKAVYQLFRERNYNTRTGSPEIGDLFYREAYYPFWDNQTGPDLIAIVPGGHEWNIDSRASNCTMKEDRLHRCWIRHGEPPAITVDKKGHTCKAGAGSIKTRNWHGFLRNGQFVSA